jgi:hypothetical protein
MGIDVFNVSFHFERILEPNLTNAFFMRSILKSTIVLISQCLEDSCPPTVPTNNVVLYPIHFGGGEGVAVVD